MPTRKSRERFSGSCITDNWLKMLAEDFAWAVEESATGAIGVKSLVAVESGRESWALSGAIATNGIDEELSTEELDEVSAV
jgi:hypothetical protein